MKETDLAAPVLRWLTERGWATYQEVPFRGSVADIVAIAGPVCMVVELKVAFTFPLVEQLMNWSGAAHFRVAATPRTKGRKGWRSQHALLTATGIGWVIVNERSDYERSIAERVREAVHPRFDRKVPRRTKGGLSLIEACQPEHISGEWGRAGSNNGGRWTPWRKTCEAARKFVEANPGCSIKAMIEGIRDMHHYRSQGDARSALYGWLRANKLPGIRWVCREKHHPSGGRHRMVLIPAETSVESR